MTCGVGEKTSVVGSYNRLNVTGTQTGSIRLCGRRVDGAGDTRRARGGAAGLNGVVQA